MHRASLGAEIRAPKQPVKMLASDLAVRNQRIHLDLGRNVYVGEMRGYQTDEYTCICEQRRGFDCAITCL